MCRSNAPDKGPSLALNSAIKRSCCSQEGTNGALVVNLVVDVKHLDALSKGPWLHAIYCVAVQNNTGYILYTTDTIFHSSGVSLDVRHTYSTIALYGQPYRSFIFEEIQILEAKVYKHSVTKTSSTTASRTSSSVFFRGCHYSFASLSSR